MMEMRGLVFFCVFAASCFASSCLGSTSSGGQATPSGGGGGAAEASPKNAILGERTAAEAEVDAGQQAGVDDHHQGHSTGGNASAEHHQYHVASVNFGSVQTPFAIALWVFIATLAKIGFHMTNKLSKLFPESVLLIVLGVVIGLLLFYTHLMRVSILTPTTFFMFMLPPIVLDAGYFMPNRSFFDNLGTILLFAVVGTIFNTLTIGVSLWAVGLTGLYDVELGILETFLFSALISAVDPVAVLAVFEEIHVNEVLYIVVFGESLLNDAVTVVLYHMFEAYTEMGESKVEYTDVLLGFASFFVVALGGTAIGIVWGFLTGFVTRFTNHVRVIEPLLVFVMAYLSHLTAEMFHLSGILAITFCGICAKNYVEANVSLKSHTTIKYSMKMLSSVSETIIFLFLGVSAVNDYHMWNTWFVVFTILFCTVYRAIGVLIFTSLANRYRLHKLNKVEEFVMAYGGLRGAVAFALALTIDVNVVKHKSMFVTATIAMVYFTVLIQGITIKPLVQLLRVKKSSKRKVTMNERIHERFMDHLMAGMEDIYGHSGNHHLRDKFKYYDNKYLRKWFVRDHHAAEPKILETFSKLNVRDARDFIVQNGSFVPLNALSTEMSLGNLFRNYTQSNLEGDNPYCQSSADTSVCNLDMQELDYSPSTKDLNDAKLHHILSDAMFKAPRRPRNYGRSAMNEQEPHPPFRHMVRMQIRHMLSEQYKNPKKAAVRKKNAADGNGYVYTKNNYLSPVMNTGQRGDGRTTARIRISGEKGESDGCHYYVNAGLEDEDGITFTATPTGFVNPLLALGPLPRSGSERDAGPHDGDVPSGRRPPPPPPPEPRTATESQLPWRRGSASEDAAAGSEQASREGNDDRPVVQQEFPSWVENREYNAYVSPTTTFLDRLEAPRSAPSLFGIFGGEEMREAPSSGGQPPAAPPTTDKHTTQL